MVPEDLLFWISQINQAPTDDPSVLCRRHADAMVVPAGWTLDDRRETTLRLFNLRPADPRSYRRPGRSAAARSPSQGREPEQLQIDGTGEIGRPAGPVPEASGVADGGSADRSIGRRLAARLRCRRRPQRSAAGDEPAARSGVPGHRPSEALTDAHLRIGRGAGVAVGRVLPRRRPDRLSGVARAGAHRRTGRRDVVGHGRRGRSNCGPASVRSPDRSSCGWSGPRWNPTDSPCSNGPRSTDAITQAGRCAPNSSRPPEAPRPSRCTSPTTGRSGPAACSSGCSKTRSGADVSGWCVLVSGEPTR